METIKNRCVIIGGGDCSIEQLKDNIDVNNDYVICADSGYDYAVESGVLPDALIGDFDSIKANPDFNNKITLPVEKDVTDTVAAYNLGVEKGYKSFVLFGGTGGRFEHTFANISLMANASNNERNFVIIDEKHIFRSITNSSIKLSKKNNQQISVFAYGNKAYGVTLNGFHYPLSNFTLEPFNCALSISNDIIDDYGEIIVKSGTLLIIETNV